MRTFYNEALSSARNQHTLTVSLTLQERETSRHLFHLATKLLAA